LLYIKFSFSRAREKMGRAANTAGGVPCKIASPLRLSAQAKGDEKCGDSTLQIRRHRMPLTQVIEEAREKNHRIVTFSAGLSLASYSFEEGI
jgi:hypothetical protein